MGIYENFFKCFWIGDADEVGVITGLWVNPTQKWYSTIMDNILRN